MAACCYPPSAPLATPLAMTSPLAPPPTKIFLNRDDVDFTSAEDLPSTQDVELVEDPLAQRSADYALKVRWRHSTTR
jgi:hypothetical protein